MKSTLTPAMQVFSFQIPGYTDRCLQDEKLTKSIIVYLRFNTNYIGRNSQSSHTNSVVHSFIQNCQSPVTCLLRPKANKIHPIALVCIFDPPSQNGDFQAFFPMSCVTPSSSFSFYLSVTCLLRGARCLKHQRNAENPQTNSLDFCQRLCLRPAQWRQFQFKRTSEPKKVILMK